MQVVDIRDVFISILVVISKSVKECIDAAFLLYNRGNNLTRIKTVGSSTSTSDENIDRKMVSNKSLFHILSLLNISCSYFSDKYLEQSQVEDLVDSVFATSSSSSSSSSSSLASTSPSKSSHTSVSENGKIKRLNFYEFSDVIVLHPLLEMMISIQFQGPLKDKMEL